MEHEYCHCWNCFGFIPIEYFPNIENDPVWAFCGGCLQYVVTITKQHSEIEQTRKLLLGGNYDQ